MSLFGVERQKIAGFLGCGMNWSDFFKTGAVVQLDASHYWLGVGPFSSQNNADGHKSSLFYTDFFLQESQPWRIPRESLILTRSELLARFVDFSGESRFDWQPADRLHFSEQFQAIQDSIADRQIQKAVPVTFERSRQKPFLQGLLKRLVTAPEGLWAYAYWDENGGVAGLTPEILFSRDENVVETYALAGTRPRGDESRLPLQEDAKEVREHEFVVEALWEKLKALGIVEKSATELVSLPTLEHLKTVLRLELAKNIEFGSLVKALHPTPALGTYPAELGLDYLRKIDKHHALRKEFGAPFGVKINDRRSQCLVAIRNIQWDQNGSTLFSGCGVVEKSELEREWGELALKRQAVKSLLGLEV